jgi:AraC-like DNA-binding protein
MLIDFITILSCYAIIVTTILIIRQNDLIKVWPLLFFLCCVLLYLVIEYVPDGIIFKISLIGPFLLPYSFWLASKRIFSDKPIPLLQSLVTGSATIIIYYALYFYGQNEITNSLLPLISAIISFFFILLAIYEAQHGKEIDLINKRKRLRTVFIYAISIIALITLMAELGLQNKDQQLPKLIQRLVILLFTTYILLVNTHWKDFLFTVNKKSIELIDNELIDQIQQKMIEDDFYSQENLTIKKLAETLNEQEYIVRRTINQQLNYRNFTDFLNSYRIAEAKSILADSTQKKTTVLEIAYKVGFNSIGPFNRAFRLNTGITPTDYRRKYLSNS